MPGELPFLLEGRIVEIMVQEIAIVKVSNGNQYHLTPSTPGIDFYKLKVEDRVVIEVTSRLVRVLSAIVLTNDK
jgi:ATP-dependent 26S proteasome regulatory subunit